MRPLETSEPNFEKLIMKALGHFSIPVKGLGLGIHTYDFQLDKEFFTHFENSQITSGSIKVRTYFDKREDMYVFTFDWQGTTQSVCDRCLTDIQLPLKGAEQLVVKFAEVEREEVDVIYIPMDTSHFNVARYIYEYVSLSLPLIKVYDCEEDENPPCDDEMLDRLYADEQSDEKETTTNPIWDVLKDLNNNN
ncbi:MAG: DUF177 domain-containing protein [Saprospiraceae bacterium]